MRLRECSGAAIRVLFGLPETGPGQENSGSLLLHFLSRPIHGLPGGDATSTQVTRCAVLAKKKTNRLQSWVNEARETRARAL